MKKVILDGKILADSNRAQDYLKYMLEFPEYYGKNLDALYDSLAELCDVELVVQMPNRESDYLHQIIEVFADVAEGHEGIKVKVEPAKAENEQLILVDLFDREIGPGEKMETHVREQLHRAFSVFIVHDGKMLIQQRALDKYHSAGLWANACCSHPRYGETFEESVQTRLEVELGIPTGTCQPKELFSFVYYSRYDGLSEYEYDHVLLVDYAGKIWENPEEVMDTRWISYEDLQKEMEKEPAKFSTWFMIAAPKVLKELNK